MGRADKVGSAVGRQADREAGRQAGRQQMLLLQHATPCTPKTAERMQWTMAPQQHGRPRHRCCGFATSFIPPAPHLEALEALPPVVSFILLPHAGPHVCRAGQETGQWFMLAGGRKEAAIPPGELAACD